MSSRTTNKAARPIAKPKELKTEQVTNFFTQQQEEITFEEVSHESGYKRVRVKVRLEIDPIDVYRLAQLDCSAQEIAYALNVDLGTLTRHYNDVIDSGHNDLRVTARQQISRKVRAGDPTALFKYAEKELGYNTRMIVEQKNSLISDDDLITKLANVDPTQLIAVLQQAEQLNGNSIAQH